MLPPYLTPTAAATAVTADHDDSQSGVSMPPAMATCDPMALYSVIHKEPKRNSHQQMAPLASREETETPSIAAHSQRNSYEDTESEYAVQLRRQTHRHLMGADGGYGDHYGTVGRPQPSIISAAGPVQPNYATLNGYGHMQRAMQVPQDLDLATTRYVDFKLLI